MSVFQEYRVLQWVKRVLKTMVFKPGKTVTIWAGPLKGCRYVVNERSGWAPIYGGWEPEAQKMYQKYINRGKIVYDLGANTGIHSLLFSKLVGPEGKVFAFEPYPLNIYEIESINTLNKVTNVRIVSVAIANEIGSVQFKLGQHTKGGSLTGIGGESGESITVKVETLDHLVDEGMDLPDFIKIDIEGGEADALQGFSRTMQRIHPTFFIDLHTPEQDVRVGKYFKSIGYSLFRLNPSHRSPFLVPIKNLDAGWPDPDGVWGMVAAIREKF
jgi:FkbM family methyltransferase